MKIILYFVQFCLILILFLIFKLIGYKKASNLVSKIGRAIGETIKSDKVIIQNLNTVKKNTNLEIKDERKFVDDVFSNYGRILSDYVFLKKFKNGEMEKYINIKGREHLDEIKEKNKNVVFISGHFNNFELMAMFIDSYGINLSAIYRPLNNIFLNKIMENIRKKYICKNQIKKGKSGTRELLSFIKRNYSVALMIDQRVTEGIKSNFFGKSAFTTTIPAQIVRKFGCEVVPVYIERFDEVKFNLSFEKPIKFNNKSSIQEITSELNKVLEKMVLNNPNQWIFTHNRWK